MAVIELEPGLPPTIRDAFAHINQVTAPTLADLKCMVLVEAASETLYRRTAEGTDNAAVIALLHHNAAEEMKHARRVAEALRLMGEDFPAPAAEDNPYLAGGSFPLSPVTPEALRKLAVGEFGGEALYEGWAANFADPAVADLLRANGREETDHGNRLMEAAALLEG